jgi:hypothetical protein
LRRSGSSAIGRSTRRWRSEAVRWYRSHIQPLLIDRPERPRSLLGRFCQSLCLSHITACGLLCLVTTSKGIAIHQISKHSTTRISITTTEPHAPESRHDLRCEQHIHTVTATFLMYIFTIPLCHLGSHLLWPFFRTLVIFFVWDRLAVVLSYLATASKTQAICRHERQDLVPIEEERAT